MTETEFTNLYSMVSKILDNQHSLRTDIEVIKVQGSAQTEKIARIQSSVRRIRTFQKKCPAINETTLRKSIRSRKLQKLKEIGLVVAVLGGVLAATTSFFQSAAALRDLRNMRSFMSKKLPPPPAQPIPPSVVLPTPSP